MGGSRFGDVAEVVGEGLPLRLVWVGGAVGVGGGVGVVLGCGSGQEEGFR